MEKRALSGPDPDGPQARALEAQMLGGNLDPICWTRPSGALRKRIAAARSGAAPTERLSMNWPPMARVIRKRLPARMRASFLRPKLTSRINPTTRMDTTASGITGSRRYVKSARAQYAPPPRDSTP